MLERYFRKLFQKSGTIFPGGFVRSRFIMDRINGGPVLVVGDYTGRHYFPISERFETKLLDIVDNNIVKKRDDLVLQSITEKTSFPDGYFNFVVLAEVIEHLWEDKAALEEINRLLPVGGGLIMTVPYFNDEPEFHYRIHSPKTIKRLLHHSGFAIVDYQERGVIESIPIHLIVLLAILLYPVLGRSVLLKFNNLLYLLHDKVVGKDTFKINRLSKRYGALIYAVKSTSKIDSLSVQIQRFKR